MTLLETARRSWHPIAASQDLPYRHVYHGQLLGQEMAVWRADDNHVNVWENRCLHRGVRLSIGINDGRELKCQYHGWRYANRTAGCTYIPAHPADAPARTITNRTFPSVERHGLIWTALELEGEPPVLDSLLGGPGFALRGLPVNAPAALVREILERYSFRPSASMYSEGEPEMSMLDGTDFAVALRSRMAGHETKAVLFVQPLDSARSVVRGVLDFEPADSELRLGVLRHYNEGLSSLRDVAEARAAAGPRPEPLTPVYVPVSPDLVEMPGINVSIGRRASHRVTVERKWDAGVDIAGFELRPIQGFLPTFQPGAHVDVHLPNGLVRQYSLVNAPGETDRYVIGVKREPASRGGSASLHEVVRESDVLAISEPRNNFPLRRDAEETLFIAGGIGITPLLAMAQALAHDGRQHQLHIFAQSEAHLPFQERIEGQGVAAHRHLGLSPEATAERLQVLLADYRPGWHVYICGPGPMLEAARRIAAEAGWPDPAVHFEYFKNTREIDDSSSFEVALARSALTLPVQAGQSILDVLREAGVELPSSCEQGACGTCIATVLEGEPEHQDVYLSETERAAGNRILTCVSRSRSSRLVLDL